MPDKSQIANKQVYLHAPAGFIILTIMKRNLIHTTILSPMYAVVPAAQENHYHFSNMSSTSTTDTPLQFSTCLHLP